LAIIDQDNRRNTYEIAIPAGLSLLASNSLKASVKGMNDLQAEYEEKYGVGYYIPGVSVLFWSFRIMVGIGFSLIFLNAVQYWCWRNKKIESYPILLKMTVWSYPLPYLAITTGWIMTEVGRQPWIVYGLLLTEKGISKVVSAASVWASLATYSAVYGIIALAALYVARNTILKGPYN